MPRETQGPDDEPDLTWDVRDLGGPTADEAATQVDDPVYSKLIGKEKVGEPSEPVAFSHGTSSSRPVADEPDATVRIMLNSKSVIVLQKSIYGLKQASKSWNIRFDQAVKGFGFIQNRDEPCVYNRIKGDKLVFLILYVDDILLIEAM